MEFAFEGDLSPGISLEIDRLEVDDNPLPVFLEVHVDRATDNSPQIRS
ncbi:MAG: hypothetical protein SCM96_13315 [Acidobacteriota bacterium]|nr:hypothetical protein [Acidobacteriota bacterium]